MQVGQRAFIQFLGCPDSACTALQAGCPPPPHPHRRRRRRTLAAAMHRQLPASVCRALLAAAGRLEVVCASAAAQQGGSPPTRWLPTTVKLLHGCAALASTCPDAAAPAVAALWRSGRILLAHSTGTIAAAVGALAVGGRDASGVFAAINSHAKPFIALLECSSSAPPEAAHAPLQGLADWLLAAAQALRTLRPTHGLSGGRWLALALHV